MGLNSKRKGPGGATNSARYTTQDERRRVASVWLATGNYRQAAASIGVSDAAVHQWRAEPWWEELLDELRGEINDRHKAELDALIRKALAEIRDRLDHGDMILSRGKKVRVPISAKDAAIIVGTFLDRLQRVRAAPAAHGGGVPLDTLAAQLRQLVGPEAHAQDAPGLVST